MKDHDKFTVLAYCNLQIIVLVRAKIFTHITEKDKLNDS